jgi:sRNA-binding protein
VVEGKNNVEATITELVKAFPAALALDSSQVRPLKLGIKDDIYARSDMSHRRITAALRIYCSGANYLAACTEGAVRLIWPETPPAALRGLRQSRRFRL